MLLLLLLAGAAVSGAGAACEPGGGRLECAGAGLRRLPPLAPRLHAVDVSNNNISEIPRDALLAATDLRDLNLSANPLQVEGGGGGGGGGAEWAGGGALARVWLDACRLRKLPTIHAPRLHYLSATDNLLSSLAAGSLPGSLHSLQLARNLLTSPPALALRGLTRLQALNLAENLISELTESSLPDLPALHTLIVRRNRISYVSGRALAAVPALRVLRLEENLLTEVPAALTLLPMLEDLSLSYNRVEECGAGVLQGGRLARLELGGNPLTRLDPAALDQLPHLETLVLSESRGLTSLPALNGTRRLRTLRADRAALTSLPAALCRHAPDLRTLDLKSNQLERVPDLEECAELRVLELSSNRIHSVSARPLRGLARLHDLLLARNRLRSLPADVFRDTPRLQLLDLEDNQIEHIDIETFLPINKLEDLNVGNNVFPSLPAAGLQSLLQLKAHNNPHLRHFHPPELFPRIQTLVLSYAYHCCEFVPLMEGGSGGGGGGGWDAGAGAAGEEEERVSDFVLVPPQHMDLATWANNTDIYAHYLNATGDSGSRLRAALATWGAEWGARARRARHTLRGRNVQCLPMPGPFLPCVDLFDWWTLRCGVWAVFLLALLGNGTVVFVLVFSRSRMDVPRFLVANLAAADFFMGLYLGFLAVVDAGTLGEFRAHALAWQMSGGCRLAGFLGVLSSELSVYTLAVITLERNYAITHAMHLNKRLSLRHAAGVMCGGWVFALAAATLPLLGVSDYRKFAVCLPFETSTPAALGYVVALLAVNGFAFAVLLGCYLKMYCAIRGSQAWNSNDSRIAKRMALLVFTDFLCWSPIAFFALTAAFGAQLVSLEEAKVFTVFVLPLNSCCNPFLYAILTKQFKKDCALVCKAIEESRVTRGIGRCRHSSNFSNRQTPANTNSLAERSSGRAHAPTCACRRLLPAEPGAPGRFVGTASAATVVGGGRLGRERLLRWLRACRRPLPPPPRRPPLVPAAKRAGSVSSSVEFSSSRSDSWRAGAAGAAGGRPPPPRRAASWLVARKTSQDSNLSSSRNDSSGSAATASTGTWRTSRSAGSACAAPPPPPAGPAAAAAAAARPRLTRQPAVLGEEPPPDPAPPPHPPRALATIPSAAEPEPQPDDEAE